MTASFNVDFGGNAGGVMARLNGDGKLDVTVSAAFLSDFRWTSSVLTARGTDGASVPVPGVLGLMGLGLVGLGAASRRNQA